MLTLTYQYKLKPTNEHIEVIECHLEFARKVWNFALRERKDWVNSRKCQLDRCSIEGEYIIPVNQPRPTFNLQCKNLTQFKKENPHTGLRRVNAQAMQQVLRTLEASFVNMWERGFGFPRYKKRMRSFVFPQMLKDPLKGDTVKLPSLGWVEMIKHRPLPDGFDLKQARIVKKPSGYHVMLSLQTDLDVPDPLPHGHAVGIDLGLLSFLATSDKSTIDRPKFLTSKYGKLKSLQRKLKNKVKGSNNWKKAADRVARFHESISNTRKNWHFKTAHSLCDQADSIYAEDLNLKAMSKEMLCKHTLDAGFGQFLDILDWVCWKRGNFFAKVDPKGTSQICPSCEVNTGKKSLSQRRHVCDHCGFEADRDVAAAMVIRDRGTAPGLGVVQTVEDSSSGGRQLPRAVRRSSKALA